MSPGARFLVFLAIAMCGTLVYFAILEEEKGSHELHCGERPERMNPPRERRMIGAENVSVGIWPWHVSVLYQPNSSVPFTQICGGAVIHDHWIMTAAACVNDKQGKLLIRAGSHRLDVDDVSTQQSDVSRIISHNKFNPVTLRFNIALLKLKKPFIINEFVYPICVPDEAHAEHKYESCHITGYNVQPGDNFGILQEAKVYGLARSLCNKAEFWDQAVAADMVCAGTFSGGVDGCERNLGGPLNCFINIEERYFIIGIRVAASCGKPNRPSIYLSVSTHYWWIQHHLVNETH